MLLSVENLHVSYDNIKALHGLSFRIDEGEIVCIIGANGAGKSTTLRAISRLVPVESGTKMTFMGRDLLKYPADKVVSELGISHVPEGRRSWRISGWPPLQGGTAGRSGKTWTGYSRFSLGFSSGSIRRPEP
jgi:ABC-type branched-subunit amino acid transport system ATPase component